MFVIIKKRYEKFKKLLRWQKLALKHYQKPMPVYTKSESPGLKLHIGAGDINIQGWVNIDGRKFAHTHLVSEGFDLKEFSDSSIEEIYLCHVLEHFSFDEGLELLKFFRKKIKNGGMIRISVPDFDVLVKAYNGNDNDVDSIKSALMGGQNYSYNFHKAIFNKQSLASLLRMCGYSAIESWKTEVDFGTDLGDWSNGTILVAGKDIPISLNLKAINK